MPAPDDERFDQAKQHFFDGLAALQAENWIAAEAALRQSLRYVPDRVSTLINLSTALLKLGKHDEAAVSIAQVLAQDADNADALLNEGILHVAQNQYQRALASYDKAIALRADMPEAYVDRGRVQERLKHIDAAEADYAQAVALKPDYGEAQVLLGDLFRKNKRLDAAISAYEKAYGVDPRAPFVAGKLLHAKMLCCDWSGLDALRSAIDQGVAAGEKVVDPFAYQASTSDEALLSDCAKIFSQHWFPAPQRAAPPPRKKEKIHIGYVCGEFRDQATSILMTRVYELHDKARFRIAAFDNGIDDGSDMRRRITSAFDDWVDISALSDAQAVAEIKKRDIDILVNLNGYFGLARPELFALRASPIQVNYLGFPGTLGALNMDYLLADATVIPAQSQRHYSEKIVHLPNCYQANDSERTIAARRFSRSDFGLPEQGFVFCCFNNNYKITPETFAGWMRILKQIEGSVLWLYIDNVTAAENLRHEATRAGLRDDRVIFATPLPAPEHLARHALADLFLDTLPYNAHTTASDCLWAGLPLLTMTGQSFPGRVASSLLKAVGLPELITESQQRYEEKAVWLAKNPDALRAIREKLKRYRDQSPLFNSALITCHLERAYETMFERGCAGLAPEAFAVRDESSAP